MSSSIWHHQPATLFRRVVVLGSVAVGFTIGAAGASAQTRLTLADALRIAARQNESIDIARAGEARADAEQLRVESQRRPQLSFLGTYSRTLASEFSGAFESSGPVCAPLAVNSSASVGDRLAELERAASCGAILPNLGFDNLPFGQRNIYQFQLSFSQMVYSGGRIGAEGVRATNARRAAGIGTTAAEAQLALDVTEAFYDAALSDRLHAIAESGYQQATATYDQIRLAFEAGRQSEFELLRSQVERDSQRPAVIRSRSRREIAYLRLRQLLKMPSDAPLALDVELDPNNMNLAPPAPFADALTAVRGAGPSSDRASVRQAEAMVGVREASVNVAQAERRPSVALSSSLAPVGYPSSGAFPGTGDFRTNWSLSASVSVPVLTGGRLRAMEASAQSDLAEARAQLQQTREWSLLDSATAFEDLSAAEAALEASAGTVEQAERAYQIAELRNREGLSTQLELSDSRLSLQVAQANRAQAARDLQVARARVALLPSLPVAAR
jgi:outer membrane protein TolC